MMRCRMLQFLRVAPCRMFSTTRSRTLLKDISELPPRTAPTYHSSPTSSLLSVRWPAPPRNILLIPKPGVPSITASLVALCKQAHLFPLALPIFPT